MRARTGAGNSISQSVRALNGAELADGCEKSLLVDAQFAVDLLERAELLAVLGGKLDVCLSATVARVLLCSRVGRRGFFLSSPVGRRRSPTRLFPPLPNLSRKFAEEVCNFALQRFNVPRLQLRVSQTVLLEHKVLMGESAQIRSARCSQTRFRWG